MYLILLSVLLGAILTLYSVLSASSYSDKSSRSHTTPREIVQLLGYSSSSSITQHLHSRALANQRLRRAFRLTNTFVSDEVEVHDAFVGRMNELIRGQSRLGSAKQWMTFLQVSRRAVSSELNSFIDPSSSSSSGYAFAEFIQIVTLKIIIAGFLDPNRDIDELDAEGLRVSATLIMKLWTLSKTAHWSSIDSSESELTTLNEHLCRLLPDREMYPDPINFVIPTWETLWRLVATCIARIYKDVPYRDVFRNFLDEPTYQRFGPSNSRSRADDTDISDLCASWIINETLRLHPPSKHISRSFVVGKPFILQFMISFTPRCIAGWLKLEGDASSPQIRSQVADVEKVHLSTDIWGPNALDFEPRRWRSLNDRRDRTPTLFAFGDGPLMCVGKKWAPMAAALMIAAIFEGFEAEGLDIEGTSTIGGRAGWDGWRISRV
ncbi:hypothetical protein BDP27DRAFT_1406565 [Rhodocollybia butyracea]|uniref:Cytochrome P450 n=1 Tax=Rhodocollybia butyracea TaxID=206335 RepID=A0A9P5PE76_9AGAR|nr:hypothetical protein BDP27DRAFT_1406565 [Rhodocollybia butyracea]